MSSQPLEFNQFDTLSPDTITHIFSLLKPCNGTKGDILGDAGQISSKLFLIQKGLARVYSITEQGKEVNCYFAAEGDYLTNIDSFFTQQKSIYTVELLEDSVLCYLTYNDWTTLTKTYPEFDTLARERFTAGYLKLVERLQNTNFKTAQEKYEAFLKEHSNIQNRLSLGHIASYIGITQETLSRIRASY